MNNSDLKMNNTIEEMNHAPYGVIFLSAFALLFLFTFVIVLGVF